MPYAMLDQTVRSFAYHYILHKHLDWLWHCSVAQTKRIKEDIGLRSVEVAKAVYIL
jgi:preprotein translocase subunit SecA